MVESGSIVSTELFSYTKQGTSFSNHEWLSQILFYVVFDALGMNGLVFLKALAASLLVLLLYLTARTLNVSDIEAAAISLAAYLAIVNRVMVRPHLFSLLLLALLAWLLYGYRAGRVGWRTVFPAGSARFYSENVLFAEKLLRAQLPDRQQTDF